jgi:hypothetical protein
LRLSFAEFDDGGEIWEIRHSRHLDRRRGPFYRSALSQPLRVEEQWGWGGFTTRGGKRCQLTAGPVAPLLNRWSLFVRLADPNHHRKASSRPLLLEAIGRQTRHAGRTTVTITGSHGEDHRAQKAFTRIARFLFQL